MSNLKIDAAELREETLLIKRCALTVKGGRRMSFSAYVVVGNENGMVGFGHGKAKDVSSAVAKASKDARRHIFSVELDGTTLPHTFKGKFCSSTVLLMPAKAGTGVIASTAVSSIMRLAGVHDVLTKAHGSTNTVNMSKAAINGLKNMRSVKTVEAMRGVKVS